jgi:hypothetical protein
VAKKNSDRLIPPAGSSAGSSPKRQIEARHLPTNSPDEANKLRYQLHGSWRRPV